MDVIDEKAISRDIINPALDRLHHETIPNAQAAATAVMADGLNGIGQVAQALADTILTLDRIDGATITLGKRQ